MAQHPEAILISSVIQTRDISNVERSGLREEHFHAYRSVWAWLENYVFTYRKVPSKPVFRRAHPDFPLLKSSDVDWAIEQVKHNHLRQALATTVNEAVESIKRDDVEDALGVLAPVVSKLVRDFDGGHTLDSAADADDVYRMVSERTLRVSEHGLPGAPTGFESLDEITGGFQPGHYWVIAARLGNGKSWVMNRMAVETALAGKTALFHTLEMSRHQVALRTHTFYGRMSGHSFTNRQLNTGMGLDLVEYQDFLEGLPNKVPGSIKIVDRSRGKVSPFSIAANIERHTPDVVFIDYVQLMASGNGKRADWESLVQLSGELQSIAQETGVPMVVASQVNRDGAHGKTPPGVEQLARSDAIGQDADAVLTLRQWTRRTMQMRLAKFRHGAAGQMWWNLFDPDRGNIEECTFEEAQDFQMEDEEEDEQ